MKTQPNGVWRWVCGILAGLLVAHNIAFTRVTANNDRDHSARLTSLEVHWEHIAADLTEIKAAVRIQP